MNVRNELELIIMAWADAQTPKIPVSLENTPFDKPATGSYIQVFFLTPAVVNPSVAADTERETGILQINCCVRTGTGTRAGTLLANSIKALFPVLPKTGTVSIERPPQIGQFIPRDDGFGVVPVSISYRQER